MVSCNLWFCTWFHNLVAGWPCCSCAPMVALSLVTCSYTAMWSCPFGCCDDLHCPFTCKPVGTNFYLYCTMPRALVLEVCNSWNTISIVSVELISLDNYVTLLHEVDYCLHAGRKVPVVLPHVNLEGSGIPDLWPIIGTWLVLATHCKAWATLKGPLVSIHSNGPAGDEEMKIVNPELLRTVTTSKANHLQFCCC